MVRVAAWVAACLVLAGCATRFENFPLARGQDANEERRAVDVSHEERPLILVAISGGGSRAAALGWVILREVAKFRYETQGQSRSLVEDIGVVSSVSGGSVIAAHFALYGPEGLERFGPDFLVPDNMRTLGIDAANPVTWFRLAVTGSSRIDVVEELFDNQLFKGQTFRELNQPGKPYLIMNATDMASGEVFAFTPQRFDDICSDLERQPISAGVAASSAVPIVLSPVAFQNFSVTHCQGRAVPQWITTRLEGRFAPYLNLETYRRALYANDLRRGPNPLRKIDYLYFLDGGLADNLAIHGLLETISSPYAAPIIARQDAGLPPRSTILDALNTGKIKKIAVIVVNARANPGNDISQEASRPGIASMVGSVTTFPIESTTASVASQMSVLLAQLNAAGGGGAGNPQFTGLRVYGVQVDFDQLRVTDPAQLALRDKANAIPTLWTITEDNRRVLEQAGAILLRQHPCFQRLLLDMEIRADFVDEAFAKTGCRQAAD
ncbi:MAG TPA: patatin-like phospholipase family protein [Candidatus Bathyarchaeia archaeon]|nr:patatin-like phospholipase family protein [Candidatus Bathyarchaeia archaeon]